MITFPSIDTVDSRASGLLFFSGWGNTILLFSCTLFFCSVFLPGLCVMEEILNDWKRFSLLEEENTKVTLDDENKDAKEVILAGNFMTRRALNIEAVGRTLKPLWKTRNGFKIRDVGNHVLLFVFDNENEAERILATEPWTYDKHVIILSRYDGSRSIQRVKFHTVKFWVQLHGLPVNKLNERTAYGIG